MKNKNFSIFFTLLFSPKIALTGVIKGFASSVFSVVEKPGITSPRRK
jgi:hypothetical protein